MYKCSAKCCETLNAMEDVQRCVENCSQSLNKAQSVIGQELQTYQVISVCCNLSCFCNLTVLVKVLARAEQPSPRTGQGPLFH